MAEKEKTRVVAGFEGIGTLTWELDPTFAMQLHAVFGEDLSSLLTMIAMAEAGKPLANLRAMVEHSSAPFVDPSQ